MANFTNDTQDARGKANKAQEEANEAWARAEMMESEVLRLKEGKAKIVLDLASEKKRRKVAES